MTNVRPAPACTHPDQIEQAMAAVEQTAQARASAALCDQQRIERNHREQAAVLRRMKGVRS